MTFIHQQIRSWAPDCLLSIPCIALRGASMAVLQLLPAGQTRRRETMALLAALCCTIVKGRDNMCNVWLWHAMACYGMLWHAMATWPRNCLCLAMMSRWFSLGLSSLWILWALSHKLSTCRRWGTSHQTEFTWVHRVHRVHRVPGSCTQVPGSSSSSRWTTRITSNDVYQPVPTGTNGYQRVPTHHELNDLPFRHLMEVMAHWVMGCHKSLLVVVRYRGKKPGGILQARIKALVTVRTSRTVPSNKPQVPQQQAMEVS